MDWTEQKNYSMKEKNNDGNANYASTIQLFPIDKIVASSKKKNSLKFHIFLIAFWTNKMFFALVVVLALVASVSGTVFNKDVEHQKFMWEQFKIEHFKQYNDGEDQLRFGYFIENLKKIDERNLLEQKAGGSAVHGINKFADLSEEEFRSRYLTADIKLKTSNAKVASISKAPASTGLVDWTGIYTTPVKDQVSTETCQ